MWSHSSFYKKKKKKSSFSSHSTDSIFLLDLISDFALSLPLTPTQDFWPSLEMFSIVTIGEHYWHLVGRGQYTAKPCTGQPSTTKNESVLKVSVERLWHKKWHDWGGSERRPAEFYEYLLRWGLLGISKQGRLLSSNKEKGATSAGHRVHSHLYSNYIKLVSSNYPQFLHPKMQGLIPFPSSFWRYSRLARVKSSFQLLS